MKRPRWLHVCFALPMLVAVGAVLFDPFFRQLAFGPKFDHVPLVIWQEYYREWDNADAMKSKPAPGILDNLHEGFMPRPSPAQWHKLSGDDRREILLTMVDDPDLIVRMHVAAHLGDVPTSPEVVSALTKLLDESDERIREHALDSASKLKPPPMELFPKALEQLASGDALKRPATAYAIARFAAHDPETVFPVLLKKLNDGNARERAATLEVISRIDPRPKGVIPAVIARSKDADREVRSQALRALGFLKAEEAVPAVIAALNDPDVEIRMAATYAVVNIGPPAKAAVPILREHLRNVDPKRIAYNIPAVLALGSIGKDARDAIPDLLRFRDHEASQVREDVQKALSQIDPDNYPPQAAK